MTSNQPPVVTPGQRARQIAAVVLLALAGWVIHGFIPALAWAVVIAIATWPILDQFQRLWPQLGRTAVAFVLTLAVGVALFTPLGFAAIKTAQEGQAMIQWLTEAQRNGLATPAWLHQLPLIGSAAQSWWNSHLADPTATMELLQRLNTEGIAGWTKTLGSEVLSRLFTLAFTLLTLFFLYRNGQVLAFEATTVAQRIWGDQGKRYLNHALAALRATVNGLVLVGIAEGILFTIAYIVAGVTHPILFGVLTGLLSMIPLAAPIVFGGASIVLYAQHSVAAAFSLLAFCSVVLFVADHFVRPLIIGNAVRLPFLWVLIGIIGGLETFGLIGLFLGPSVMAVVIALWRDAAMELTL